MQSGIDRMGGGPKSFRRRTVDRAEASSVNSAEEADWPSGEVDPVHSAGIADSICLFCLNVSVPHLDRCSNQAVCNHCKGIVRRRKLA